MTGFTADWLALREPADARSRSDALVAELRAVLDSRSAILDLGAGTGANARHLAPRLGGTHAWTLVDHDAALLATLRNRLPARIEWHALNTDLCGVDALPFPPRGLVTASALLDLVSAQWLDAIAAHCAQAGAAALFALSYDGRIAFDPPHPDDERVRVLVNLHQRTDKGFGPALGPERHRCRAGRVRLARLSLPARGERLATRLDRCAAAGRTDRRLGGRGDRPLAGGRGPRRRVARRAPAGGRHEPAHRRSRGPAGAAPDARKSAVIEHVPAHAVKFVFRTRTPIQRQSGRRLQAAPTVADDHRRDRQMQPVEQPGLQKTRHRDAPTLHQRHRAAARVQRREHRRAIERAVAAGHAQHLGAARRCSPSGAFSAHTRSVDAAPSENTP